jgi:hypothetical protein
VVRIAGGNHFPMNDPDGVAVGDLVVAGDSS